MAVAQSQALEPIIINRHHDVTSIDDIATGYGNDTGMLLFTFMDRQYHDWNVILHDSWYHCLSDHHESFSCRTDLQLSDFMNGRMRNELLPVVWCQEGAKTLARLAVFRHDDSMEQYTSMPSSVYGRKPMSIADIYDCDEYLSPSIYGGCYEISQQTEFGSTNGYTGEFSTVTLYDIDEDATLDL